MNHSQVAHLWAQQTKEHGKGANLFFEGSTIYSYGRHFAIARFIQNKKGERAILFTAREYSVSTNKHKNYVRNAISGLGIPVFTVPNVDLLFSSEKNHPAHKTNLEAYVQKAAEAFASSKRARTRKDEYLSVASWALEEAARYAQFFGIRWKAPSIEASAQAIEEARKREAKRQRDEQARRKREEAEAFQEWLDGKRYSCPRSHSLDENRSAYLRLFIGKDGNGNPNLPEDWKVQTSLGAEVPYAAAVRCFSFVKLCKERKQRFEANGRQVAVGHFAVRWIDEDGNAQIGCHYFTWQRIEEFAHKAGFFETIASDLAVTETAHA